MFRILLTCEDYFPHVGGAEVCVHNLKKQLEKRGHAVTLFTNTTLHNIPNHTGAGFLPASNDEKQVVRVPWRFSPLILWQNIATLWPLIGEVDVVHCQYSFRIAALCAVLCKIRRKPMLLTQQGKGIVPEAGSRWHHALIIKFCQRISMHGATLLTATSDEILDLTAAFVPRERISLISNGYDSERFHFDPSLPRPDIYDRFPNRKILLTVRRFSPKNGIHILVQALALLKTQREDFHYVAIGDGRVRPFIEQLIVQHGLENHVTLLGKIENDALARYYQHADVVLMPSSAEARSITCIEAMGMGKPVIASRVGGLIDLLEKDGDFGTLVPIYDSEACTYDPPDTLPVERLQRFADAIGTFLRNPEMSISKAESAQAFVMKYYSWDAITTEYEALYERLLQRWSHQQ